MPAQPKRERHRLPYWVRFSLTVLGLMGFTSVFVLVVLPRRFVLQAGLVESGVDFPTGLSPFLTPGAPPVLAAWVPTPARPILPGPAERFWNTVLPLLRGGDLERAVPVFRAYLAAHPNDTDVWREFAVVLTRLERYDEAEAIYVRLRASSDDPALTLRLARLLRDRGETARALALYGELVASQTEDDALRREYAEALTGAARYDAAAAEYRRLLERRPGDDALRLALARVLYWGGHRTDALALLAAVPPGSAQAADAGILRARIESELPVAAAPVDTLLQGARAAVVAGDFAEATRRYQALLARDPTSAALWLEWADFLQYQRQDLPAARDALHQLATLRDLTWAERFRLAQLHAWTGDEATARTMLLGLVREDSTSAPAWAMLGDLYRYGNDRLAAHDAYRTALRLDPRDPQALQGEAELERQTTAVIAARERPSAGPELLYFGDTDGYHRWDLGARASFQWGPTVLVARAGYRTLDGIALDGTTGSDRGPFVELETGRWWRLGTVRLSASAGAERLDAFGTKPTLAVHFAVPDASGTAVEASYEHAPAYHRTMTLESALGDVGSDYLEASAYRNLGTGWNLAGLGAAMALHGAGSSNWRFNGTVTLRHQIASPLSVALTSQLLTFTNAAPVLDRRRLYWDPEVFGAAGLQVEARGPTGGGWDLYGRLTGGAGFVRERNATATDFVPQFIGEAGVRYDSRRLTFASGLAYLRGREGGYRSFGANASLGVRY
jgi:tetratricopeptide (TPR) repeat protein